MDNIEREFSYKVSCVETSCDWTFNLCQVIDVRTSINFIINFTNKICIHCQYTCVITYSSVGSWAMMPCVSSYISLHLDLNLPCKPIQWFITKTGILPHRASSTCDKKLSKRTSINHNLSFPLQTAWVYGLHVNTNNTISQNHQHPRLWWDLLSVGITMRFIDLTVLSQDLIYPSKPNTSFGSKNWNSTAQSILNMR